MLDEATERISATEIRRDLAGIVSKS